MTIRKLSIARCMETTIEFLHTGKWQVAKSLTNRFFYYSVVLRPSTPQELIEEEAFQKSLLEKNSIWNLVKDDK